MSLTFSLPLKHQLVVSFHACELTYLSICSGEYGDAIDLKFLKDFHRRRVQLLAESGADLIAFETVPNKLEAQVWSLWVIYLEEIF